MRSSPQAHAAGHRSDHAANPRRTRFAEPWSLPGTGPGSDARQTLFHQYDTLLSPSYFQYCLRLLVRAWFPQRGDAKFDKQFPGENQNVLYPDGSLQWCEVFLDQTPEEIRRSVGKPPTEMIAADSARPDAERCRLLEEFVTGLLDSGVAVEFFLPPPNPWLFEAAHKDLERAGKPNPSLEAEAYVRGLAEKHGLRVRGSFDPRRIGVTEKDYIDLVHLRRKAIERIWNQDASPPK
jgi:hypothetical protein